MSTKEPQENEDGEASNGAIRTLVAASEGLDTFFEENKYLFTLIGVFGAVSIYLTEAGLPATKDGVIPYENFVFAGGFGIVILLAGLILLKLADEVWVPGERLLRLKNLPLLGFGLLFFLLLAPILAYVTTYNRVWAAFYAIAFWLLGFMTYFGFLDFILESDVHERLGDLIGISKFKSLMLITSGVVVGAFLVILGAQLVFGQEVVQQASAGETFPDYFWLHNGLMVTSIWLFMSFLTVILKTGEKAWRRMKNKAVEF